MCLCWDFKQHVLLGRLSSNGPRSSSKVAVGGVKWYGPRRDKSKGRGDGRVESGGKNKRIGDNTVDRGDKRGGQGDWHCFGKRSEKDSQCKATVPTTRNKHHSTWNR